MTTALLQTVWNFEFRICLVFGAWNLGFGAKRPGAKTIFLLPMGD
jgi:hypothetical protein